MKAIIDKQVVKKLYAVEGLNAAEIARKLNQKVDTIKKCIQRNFSDLLLDHKRVRYRNKQIEESINREATKYMSDASFIKKNPSIYKTNCTGDIIVNAPEEILPWDVPRKFKNSNNKKLIDRRIKKSKYRKDELFS